MNFADSVGNIYGLFGIHIQTLVFVHQQWACLLLRIEITTRSVSCAQRVVKPGFSWSIRWVIKRNPSAHFLLMYASHRFIVASPNCP
jgi:hypothetical protein